MPSDTAARIGLATALITFFSAIIGLPIWALNEADRAVSAEDDVAALGAELAVERERNEALQAQLDAHEAGQRVLPQGPAQQQKSAPLSTPPEQTRDYTLDVSLGVDLDEMKIMDRSGAEVHHMKDPHSSSRTYISFQWAWAASLTVPVNADRDGCKTAIETSATTGYWRDLIVGSQACVQSRDGISLITITSAPDGIGPVGLRQQYWPA